MSYYGGRSGGYGDGGWGGGGYNRNFGGYGGGYRFGGGGGGGGGRDRYGGGGGGGGWRDDRRRGGGGGWRGRGGGGGGGRGGGRGGGFKRNFRGGGGPPSKFQKQENEDNWSEPHEMMQSKFMVSKPDDFEEDWVFVVCPPGKRRLLVAALDITQSYNNAGAPDLKFHSCLPSGSAIMNDVHKNNDLTILDCVYSGEKKCFYIVDMVHWKHYPYTETENEFRSFVLSDKYAQLKNPTEVTKFNEHPLHLLDKFPCTQENIEKALKDSATKVEGLLFFRKSELYLPGDCVSNLWLKLDKMEALLDIPIPEGVNFAATNTKDEKRVVEQEEREKRMAERAKLTASSKEEEKQADNGEEKDLKEDTEEDGGIDGTGQETEAAAE